MRKLRLDIVIPFTFPVLRRLFLVLNTFLGLAANKYIIMTLHVFLYDDMNYRPVSRSREQQPLAAAVSHTHAEP